MAADVQSWLDGPSSNFGWLLRGNEEVIHTTKRFDSKENPVVAMRPSLEVTFTPIPDTTPPDVPANLVATPGFALVVLEWDDNSEPDLVGYNVSRSTTPGGPYSKINDTLIAAGTYTDTGVSHGIAYYYVVTAVDDSGNESGEFTEASAVPLDAPPAPPVGLVAAGTDTEVALDWDDSLEPDLAGYNVYRSTSRGGPHTRVNLALVAGSEYTDTGLSRAVVYYYLLTAVDDGGNESGRSAEVSAITVSPTPIPGISAPGTLALVLGVALVLVWGSWLRWRGHTSVTSRRLR